MNISKPLGHKDKTRQGKKLALIPNVTTENTEQQLRKEKI